METAAFKLFVSHSSRLDDVEGQYTDKDQNWCFLRRTCDAIRDRYGDSIELLVDKEGKIRPGSEWNRELNLWLAECHAAIILFSKRAVNISDWVKKEAAILGWRAARNPNFKLIPVTLAGESTLADLAAGYFGALEFDRIQCIEDVDKDKPEQILEGLVKVLGSREAVVARCTRTPLDILQGVIAKVLQRLGTVGSLDEALKAVGGSVSPDGRPDIDLLADALARRFLRASPEDVRACFKTFKAGIAALEAVLDRDQAMTVFKSVRSLWVHPGAASHFTLALEKRHPLALAGEYLVVPDPFLNTEAYTLERYLERAWPVRRPYEIVTVRGSMTADKVKSEIRRKILGDAPLPPGIKEEELDESVNDDDCTIVLVVSMRTDTGGLPDPALRADLSGLISLYSNILLVFAVEPTLRSLPDGLDPVEPPLDPGSDRRAYLAERNAKARLNKLFPKTT